LNWKADTSRATKTGHLHVLTTEKKERQEIGLNFERTKTWSTITPKREIISDVVLGQDGQL
jgi:hypothetical protein